MQKRISKNNNHPDKLRGYRKRNNNIKIENFLDGKAESNNNSIDFARWEQIEKKQKNLNMKSRKKQMQLINNNIMNSAIRAPDNSKDIE